MKMRKFFYLLSLVLLISACRKYPKDPFISLRTPKKRITTMGFIQSKFELWKFIVNGIDSTGYYNFARYHFFF